MNHYFPAPGHKRLLVGIATFGAIVLAAAAVLQPDRTWANLLIGSFYLLTIGLGGALFVR